MKIIGKMTPQGMKRTIDFQGAELPDGRKIENVLNENEELKSNIETLKDKLKQSESLLGKIIPNKVFRIIIELILIVFTILGIIIIFV